MTYTKQLTVLLYLMLFSQAFTCWSNKVKNTSTPISSKPCGKQLALDDDDTEEEDADNESGYGSDSELIENDNPTKSNVHFDFEAEIYKMRKVADDNRRISWELSGDRLIREAANSGNSLYAGPDYVVQILNIYRAAKKICALYGKDGSIFANMGNKSIEYYRNHINETENFWIEKVKHINKTVVSTLHKMVFPEENMDAINEKLRLAENYVGLDDPHYNVTTTFKIEGKKFGLEDTKWLKLTENQKLAFINRKSENWYKRLEPFEQKLIDAYVDKFLDGQHYIPTQIRNLPGCRNAYQKRVLAYDQNNNPTVLGRYYHSGALPSLIQDKDPTISTQITQENWKQVLQHTQDIEVMSLNHNVNLTIPGVGNLGEKHIIAPTKHIVGEDRFIYLPINHIGTFTTPIFKPHVNKLVDESIDFYKKTYPNLPKSFIKGTKADRKKKIEKITNSKDKAYFKRLEDLKEAAERTDRGNSIIHNGPQVYNNYYANIAADYIACKSVLGQATSTSPVLFFCKSGKDRTGMLSYCVDVKVLHMYLSSNSDSDADHNTKLHTIGETVANTRHTQSLAGFNGGMPGRNGMKPVRGNEASRNFTAQLFPKTAQFIKIDLS